ncbi:hypothetical protein EDD86DRAFT_193750 [Gorgonomyces haynaldii]|nr:hypothetical protein EDD86DRAFT_193750 [Gorgonomyces haynaldii]
MDEPTLKYTKWKSFTDETVATLDVSHRFIAVGTHNGNVHILDLEGNPIKIFELHKAQVTSVIVDQSGEYLGSSGLDGQIAIQSLYSTENMMFPNKRPMQSVCFEPDFVKKPTRSFLVGGQEGNLTLMSKGWFGYGPTIIHSGDGPIYGVSWQQDILVWSTDLGIHFYDLATKQKFEFIPLEQEQRQDLVRCNICWKSLTVFMIGWGETVIVGEIKDRDKKDAQSNVSAKYINIMHQFKTPFLIAGISPFKEHVLLLAFVGTLQDYLELRSESHPPEIHLLDLQGHILDTDQLPIQGFAKYKLNDYRLVSLEEGTEAVYYLLSPRDIFLARPRDLNDHVDWLEEQGDLKAAVEAVRSSAESLLVKPERLKDIGKKYLDKLLSETKYEEASLEMSKILGQDLADWEMYLSRYRQQDKGTLLIPYLPIDSLKQEWQPLTDLLLSLVEKDYPTLLITIRTWPESVYSIQRLLESMEPLANPKSDTHLLEVVSELYKKKHLYAKALQVGLWLRQEDVLDLVEQHNLFSVLQDDPSLVFDYELHLVEKHRVSFSFDSDLPLSVLKTRQLVQTKLDKHPRYLHCYLDALWDKDTNEATDFQKLQVKLYCDHDPSKLLNFLRVSNAYSVPDAYALVEERDLVPEMMFLLGKLGNNRKALYLIIDRLGDVERAIEFTKEQNDQDLWLEFLTFARDKPPFIVALLKQVGSYLDPLIVIESIPEGLIIPDLKPALIKILKDTSGQMSLLKGYEDILLSDTWEALMHLVKQQTAGRKLNDPECQICGNGFKPDQETHLVSFHCQHVFHDQCIDQRKQISSPLPKRKEKLYSSIHAMYSGKRVILEQPRVSVLRQQLQCPLCSETK